MRTDAAAPAMSAAQPVQAPPGASSRPVNTDSFDTNPSIGGIPAMDAQPSTTTANEAGARPMSRGILPTSRVWARWSTTPTIMNSPDLKSACAMTWRTAATIAASVPTPIAAVMSPSRPTVE